MNKFFDYGRVFEFQFVWQVKIISIKVPKMIRFFTFRRSQEINQIQKWIKSLVGFELCHQIHHQNESGIEETDFSRKFTLRFRTHFDGQSDDKFLFQNFFRIHRILWFFGFG